MSKPRVVHYLNQFFGQIGGEDKAGTAPLKKDGPVGPGLALNAAFKGEAEVVGTVICGDSHFAENMDAALGTIVGFIREYRPDLVVAGPAFNAGRYGTACGAVADAVQAQLGIPAVTGMYVENPGVDMYKKTLHIVSTTDSAIGMRDAVPRMAALALKLYNKRPVSPEEDHYIPRGTRRNYFATQTGAERAVEMLVAKLSGAPFATELPMPAFDRVPPNPAVGDMTTATVALVTSGGIVPKGNPDRIESSSASRYGKYPLAGVDDLTAATHATAHGGYDPVYANEDADRVLPVDVMRDLAAEKKIGKLHEYWYATVGNGTAVASAASYGRSIAEDLKAAGVQAVILTST